MATCVDLSCPSPVHDSQGPSDPNSSGVYISRKLTRYSKVGVELSEDHKVCVVAVGVKLLYCLPGFDVHSVELRHIQVKGSSKFGSPEDMFDLFTRNDFSLSRAYPCKMTLKEVTIVKVSFNCAYL